jgi:serine/threonine protein kinase/transglutaminase-like putative cysteine protease
MSFVPKQPPTELPASFGRYRLLKLLGQGGMGSVYLAHDTQLDRAAALKIPLLDSDEGSQVLARFFREARAAAALHHPNICPIYDVGEYDGLPYLTMAYIEGKPLADFVLIRPPSPRQSALLVRKLALALAEAHKRNIIHRDLKPANIMIDKRGEPIIMDFGLARRAQKTDPRLTEKGKLLGTPAYMPPEQVMGDVENMGPASDIYSLGVILYELLAGRLPFAGADMMATLSRVLMDEPPPPSQFRPDLDAELEAVCLKAMAKKVKDRYANMPDFAVALFEYLRTKTGTSDAAAAPPPSAARPAPRTPVEKKEPAGLRISAMGGLRSVAQLQAQLPGARERDASERDTKQRDDTKPARRKKRRKSALARVPIWAWCSAAAAVVILLVGWIIYAAGNHGTIRIEVAPGDAEAEIEINGKVGQRPGEEFDLPVGTHNLTVQARRYKTLRQPLVIHRGSNDKLVVTLERLPKRVKKEDAVGKTGGDESATAYIIERAEARQIRAVLTADIKPNSDAQAWYNYAARPPDLPGQEIIKSTFTGGVATEDLSEGRRPLFLSRTGEAKRAHVVLTVDATLYSRRLSPRPAVYEGKEAADLGDDDVRRYTRTSVSLDGGDSSLREWMTAEGLKRKEAEVNVALARRVFLFLKSKFFFDGAPRQDRRASRVCKAGKADAAGLCALYVTVLRVNDVPARVLFGRRALAGEAYVQAEFFARGVGWVPVDVTGAVSDSGAAELAYFGDSPGDFLVLHVDPDIRVSNPVVRDYTDFAMQDVWSWWQGTGSDTGNTLDAKWSVGRLSAQASGIQQPRVVKKVEAPITGERKPGVGLLDKLMLRYREKLGCSAATVALARNGVPWMSRGYGWLDSGSTIPAGRKR